ncbi:hypothetical protein K402DRAFT_335092 [Aulographum hederae CBS 113979]|uniref:Ribonuclease P/MRP protein subunit POP5 n=1 Tax=Aulographum hederae CBS 113979 TaxID=1176131 RepID=A0A6G1GWG3_9PEZI|nr:hypothetical protein K402DRAFT_335092 [Aulographum hederae CBS 113979]
MVRIKNRYLLVNFLYPTATLKPSDPLSTLPATIQFQQPTDDRLTPQIITRMIRNGVEELFGDYGGGMVNASISVKYFSPATSTAILKIARAHYRLVWAALSYVTRLPKPVDKEVVVRVVRVSGTIRKAEEEAIKRAKVAMLKARKDGDVLGELGLDGGLWGRELEKEEVGGIEDEEANVDEDEEEDEDSDMG